MNALGLNSVLLCVLALAAVPHPSAQANNTAPLMSSGDGPPPATASRIPIYIGGIFAFPDDPVFGMLPYTVEKAVEHVNNLSGILDGYELNMRWKLTNGKPDQALKVLNELLYEGPPVLMTWGPMISRQALLVNEVAPQYNVVQVCLANSQSLRDRSRYPYTVQMYWSEDSINPARVKFVKHMKWTQVAIIFEDNEYFRTNADNLQDMLHEDDVSLLAIEAISDSHNPDQQLASLQKHDARIIFALSYFDTAINLFCKIYHMQMFGPKYVWIIVGWYPKDWWRKVNETIHGCTAHQLRQTLCHHLSVSAWRSVDDVTEIHYGTIRPPAYQTDYIRDLLAREGVDRLEHIESYDVLITIAMALNRSIDKLAKLKPPKALDDFTYTDGDMTKNLLLSIHETTFVGPTGPVLIEQEGYRSENNVRYFIAQFQDNKSYDIMECVKNCTSFVPYEDRTFTWPDGLPPVDGEQMLYHRDVVTQGMIILMFSLASIGIVLDLGFLTINIRFRKERAIKISTPPLNNLIVVGSLLLYTAVFFFGINTSTLRDEIFIHLCYMKICSVCVGVSLSLGALFMKTYRIHAIFSRAVAKLKRIDLPNYKLIVGVLLVVAVDFVIFAAWGLFGDTVVRETTSEPVLDDSQPNREVFVVSVNLYCTSKYAIYFAGALYLTKGILLMFGIFLAWETRNISVSSLNDSKYIAMSIYLVAIVVAITLPSLHLESVIKSATVQFTLVGFAIIITNTAVLFLVFLPKISRLRKSNGGKNFHVSMMAKHVSTISLSKLSDCASTEPVSRQLKESLYQRYYSSSIAQQLDGEFQETVDFSGEL